MVEQRRSLSWLLRGMKPRKQTGSFTARWVNKKDKVWDFTGI